METGAVHHDLVYLGESTSVLKYCHQDSDNLVKKTPNHPKALRVGRSHMRGSEAALMKEPAESSWKCFLHHRANAALSGRTQRYPATRRPLTPSVTCRDLGVKSEGLGMKSKKRSRR